LRAVAVTTGTARGVAAALAAAVASAADFVPVVNKDGDHEHGDRQRPNPPMAWFSFFPPSGSVPAPGLGFGGGAVLEASGGSGELLYSVIVFSRRFPIAGLNRPCSFFAFIRWG